MTAIPSIITALGWAFGCVGIACGQPEALALSLAADVADGACARRFGWVSSFGARLDLAVDVALAQAAVWTYCAPVTAAVAGALLVLIHAAQPNIRRPISGRAAVFVGVACVVMGRA